MELLGILGAALVGSLIGIGAAAVVTTLLDALLDR